MISTLFKYRIVAFIVIAVATAAVGCTKDSDELPKEILAVHVKSENSTIDSTEISVRRTNDTVYVTVPAGSDVTQITPTFKIVGDTIVPGSGVTQDFTKPITYTITAEDGTVKKYVVAVLFAPPPDLLFVGTSRNIFYAIKARGGRLQWKFEGESWFTYAPAYHADLVYVGCGDGNVYAFDRVTGKIIWRFKAPLEIASDVVYNDGIVYVGAIDNRFYALNALTGENLWSFETGGHVSSKPTVVGNTVYVGSNDFKVYALNKKTGAKIWECPLNGMINQSGTTYADGTIYIGASDSRLYAINAGNGQIRWTFTADWSLEHSTPAVSKGVVYIAGGNEQWMRGGLYAVKATDGTLVWKALDNRGFSTSPIVSKDRVYINCDDEYFYCINTVSGATAWRKQLLTNGANATITGGVVYIGGGGTGHVYAIDEVSAGEKWRFPISGISTSDALFVSQNGVAAIGGE